MSDFSSLPEDLPEPTDDGACDHLLGLELPDMELRIAGGGISMLRRPGRRVLYLYPRTGGPGVELPDDWDLIPGARGCTPQSCAFRDHQAELARHGVDVVGMSAQPIAEQAEFSERMHIPFPLLNDSELAVAHALRLPTMKAGGRELYKRLTMLIEDNIVEKVWYPVFPPDRNASDVLAYLVSRGS